MATLTVRKISFGTYTPGASPTYSGLDASAVLDTPIVTGDQFIDDSRTFLWCKNSGSILTVSVTAQKPSDEGITTNVVVSIPATTGSKFWGPFGSRFIDVNGYVQITYPGGITGLTIAAFSLAEKGRG